MHARTFVLQVDRLVLAVWKTSDRFGHACVFIPPWATTDNFSPEYIAHLNSISHGSLLRTRKQSVMTKFRSCWAGKFGKVLLNRLNVSTTISYCAPPPCAHALRLPFAVSVIMWQKWANYTHLHWTPQLHKFEMKWSQSIANLCNWKHTEHFRKNRQGMRYVRKLDSAASCCIPILHVY